MIHRMIGFGAGYRNSFAQRADAQMRLARASAPDTSGRTRNTSTSAGTLLEKPANLDVVEVPITEGLASCSPSGVALPTVEYRAAGSPRNMSLATASQLAVH